MRTRWRLLASTLTCTVLIAAYQNETTIARALSNGTKGADLTGATLSANVTDDIGALAPGEFRFTTGRDRQPQHIHGPVSCDTHDDTHRITIGDRYDGGVEIGLPLDESTLKYVDLGNRGGTYFALFNDEQTPGTVRTSGETYVVSGYATGTSASQHISTLYFDISVACP